MKKVEKKFWMLIPSYCYISVKETNVLFYNTISFKSFFYNDAKIADLTRKLVNNQNSYCVIISHQEKSDVSIKKLIEDLQNAHMIDLIDFEHIHSKPYHLMPNAFFEKTFITEKVDIIGEGEATFDLPGLIKSINIQLTGNCRLTCTHCQQYYKQIPHCHKTKHSNDLNIDLMKSIIDQVDGLGIAEITFSGGDIFSYEYFDALWNYLKVINKKIVFKVNSKQLKFGFEEWFLSASENFEFEIVFSEIKNKEEFKKIIPCLNKKINNVKFEFLVADEVSGKIVDEVVEYFPEINYKIIPFFNGKNIRFFEDYVFLNQEDLNEIKVTMREILVSREINKLYFGKLFLLSNGDLFSNLNFNPIGNVLTTSLGHLIKKELFNKTSSWYLTRSSERCRCCVYENVCPPISNYEIITDRETACLV